MVKTILKKKTKKILKRIMKKPSEFKKDATVSIRLNKKVKEAIVKNGGIQEFFDKCIDREFEVTKEVKEEISISAKKK